MTEIEKAELAIMLVDGLLKQDSKILAIKIVRFMYKANLVEAKRFVDKIQSLREVVA